MRSLFTDFSSSLGVWCSLLLLSEEIRGPVDNIEEGEDEGEGDPGDDINALAAAGELRQPGPTASARRLWVHVDLTLPRLSQGKTSARTHQWLLSTQQQRHTYHSHTQISQHMPTCKHAGRGMRQVTHVRHVKAGGVIWALDSAGGVSWGDIKQMGKGKIKGGKAWFELLVEFTVVTSPMWQ